MQKNQKMIENEQSYLQQKNKEVDFVKKTTKEKIIIHKKQWNILKKITQENKELHKELWNEKIRIEQKIGRLLNLDFEYPMHIHFWKQHKERYGKETTCDYEKTLNEKTTPIYNENPTFEIAQNTIPQILEYIIKNWQKIEQSENFQKLKKDGAEILKSGKNIAILTNHSDWSTQLISLFIAQKAFPFLKEENNVSILGPGATTIKKRGINPRDFAQALGKVLIPIPNTERAMPKNLLSKTIQEIKEKISLHNQRFVRGLLQFLLKEKTGKIIHLAPSGTSDKREKGKLKLISQTPETENLIQTLQKKDVAIVPIGINADYFTNWNGQFEKKEIQINIGDIIPPNTIKNKEDVKSLMKKIASLVKNKKNETIGIFEENN